MQLLAAFQDHRFRPASSPPAPRIPPARAGPSCNRPGCPSIPFTALHRKP